MLKQWNNEANVVWVKKIVFWTLYQLNLSIWFTPNLTKQNILVYNTFHFDYWTQSLFSSFLFIHTIIQQIFNVFYNIYYSKLETSYLHAKNIYFHSRLSHHFQFIEFVHKINWKTEIWVNEWIEKYFLSFLFLSEEP